MHYKTCPFNVTMAKYAQNYARLGARAHRRTHARTWEGAK